MEQLVDIGRVPSGKKFTPAAREPLAELGIEGEAPFASRVPLPGCWVAEADWEKANANALELWPPVDYLLRHLETVLTVVKLLGQFIGVQQVSELLAGSKSQAAEDIRNSTEKLIHFTAVLRRLLGLGASIAPMETLSVEFISQYEAGAGSTAIVEHLLALPEVHGGETWRTLQASSHH